MAKMASPEMVCAVKQITINYRDQDSLFHFSKMDIILPFSVVREDQVIPHDSGLKVKGKD